MRLFEELDYQPTPMGALTLRRRRVLSLDRDVLEVMLGDEHLMSSLFTEGEIALARLGLAAAPEGPLDVLVGGLGLGYTAAAVLDEPAVRSLVVVDALGPVIAWHRQGLVPLGERLGQDPRCRLVEADFFAFVGPEGPEGDRLHAILLDIDHSPNALLNPAHAAFYSEAGLSALAGRLHPGGVFAMWSDEAPDPAFQAILGAVFASVEAHWVAFDNPLTGGSSHCTIYVCRRAD
jgi:spermidine synthase